MTGADILREARAAGLRLRARGETILVAPKGSMTPEWAARLRGAKPAILKLLRAEAAWAREAARPADARPDRRDFCIVCGSDLWVVALVGADGSRTCAECATGRTALEMSGAAT